MTDEQLTKLFREHLPLLPVPNETKQRVNEQVQAEVNHMRTTFYANTPAPSTQPSQSSGQGDRATVQDHKDRASDLKQISQGGKGK